MCIHSGNYIHVYVDKENDKVDIDIGVDGNFSNLHYESMTLEELDRLVHRLQDLHKVDIEMFFTPKDR